MKFILASKSPRRKELLSKLASEMGFEFEIITEEVDESLEDGVPTYEWVRILAERKGGAVAAREDCRASLVISSDTLVELDGVALGKPKDREDAVKMLRSLSGRGHFVRTGVAVTYKDRVYSDTASTEVVFSDIPEDEIAFYVDSGDPMDKAGAYGIQSYIGKFVKEYRGEFDTVVGLSLNLTRKLIEKALGGR
jgi:septum formation protein